VRLDLPQEEKKRGKGRKKGRGLSARSPSRKEEDKERHVASRLATGLTKEKKRPMRRMRPRKRKKKKKAVFSLACAETGRTKQKGRDIRETSFLPTSEQLAISERKTEGIQQIAAH